MYKLCISPDHRFAIQDIASSSYRVPQCPHVPRRSHTNSLEGIASTLKNTTLDSSLVVKVVRWIPNLAPLTLTQQISTRFNPGCRTPSGIFVPCQLLWQHQCRAPCGPVKVSFCTWLYLYASFVHTLLYDSTNRPHSPKYINKYIIYKLNYIYVVCLYSAKQAYNISPGKTHNYLCACIHFHWPFWPRRLKKAMQSESNKNCQKMDHTRSTLNFAGK